MANRPIVCHVLDALLQAGVREAAVLAPPDVADEIAACVDGERPAGIHVRHLLQEPGRDGETLRAVAEFVGDAPCILHRADGLLGQPLSPFVELLSEEPSDALLLVWEDGRETKRLRLVQQRLLTALEDGVTPTPAGIAGVCLFGPGALGRLTADTQHSARHTRLHGSGRAARA